MITQSVIVRICLLIAFAAIIWVYCYMPVQYSSASVGNNTPAVSEASARNYQSPILLRRLLSSYILPETNASLIQPELPCNGSVFLVIVVCSAIPNSKARDAIRQTWGQHAMPDIQIYFLLGRTNDDVLNAAVVREGDEHNDIIQEDFLDTYNNLTLKSVMLLKWVNQTCAHATYVMKTDDDMFVNLPNLRERLQSKGHPKMLMGCLIKGAAPVKDRNSKWYVSEEMFSGKEYPPYLSGTGYVFSGEAVPGLYKAALEMEFFYLEDIFITGMCASKIGLHPVDDSGFRYKKRSNTYCTFKTLITAHRMTPEELLSMWNKLQALSTMKCKTQR